MGMNITVGRWICLLIINAIENTKETITTRAQQMIQFLSKSWCQDLLSIAFTYRGNGIRKQDTTPHDIYNVRQLGNLRIEKAASCHARDFKDTIAKNSLIREIMDCVDSSGIRK